MRVYTHPTCSTCKKVLKWLDQHNFVYETIDIREQSPHKALFVEQLNQGTPLTKMMNTSGNLYRELQLKDKIKTMTTDEIATLLSREGMLVKRPVIVTDECVSFGSQEKILTEVWL